jgi:adenosylhomocysteine nucleosidase
VPDRDRILIVTAVRAETRAVLRALSRVVRVRHGGPLRRWDGRAGERPVTIVESGIGPVRAATVLRATIAATDLVISTGFAGALVGDGAPGDLLVPPTIVWDREHDLDRYTVRTAIHETAERSLADGGLRRTMPGGLFSSPTVIASPAAKRATATRTGAVAVEMEAAGIVAVAREWDVPVLALRVLLDGADISLEHIPPDLDSSWKARAQLVTRPAAWPGVLTLARHVPGAARALSRAISTILPTLAR